MPISARYLSPGKITYRYFPYRGFLCGFFMLYISGIYLHHVIGQRAGSVAKKRAKYSQPVSSGVLCRRGRKKLRFSTNILLYLRNDTRHGHSYNGRRIGTRVWSIEWCHFLWSWVMIFSMSNNSKIVQNKSYTYNCILISRRVRFIE